MFVVVRWLQDTIWCKNFDTICWSTPEQSVTLYVVTWWCHSFAPGKCFLHQKSDEPQHILWWNCNHLGNLFLTRLLLRGETVRSNQPLSAVSVLSSKYHQHIPQHLVRLFSVYKPPSVTTTRNNKLYWLHCSILRAVSWTGIPRVYFNNFTLFKNVCIAINLLSFTPTFKDFEIFMDPCCIHIVGVSAVGVGVLTLNYRSVKLSILTRLY